MSPLTFITGIFISGILTRYCCFGKDEVTMLFDEEPSEKKSIFYWNRKPIVAEENLDN